MLYHQSLVWFLVCWMNGWGMFRFLPSSPISRESNCSAFAKSRQGPPTSSHSPPYTIINVRARRQKTPEYISRFVSQASREIWSLSRIHFITSLAGSQLFQKWSTTDISCEKHLFLGRSWVSHKHAMILCKLQRVNQGLSFRVTDITKKNPQMSWPCSLRGHRRDRPYLLDHNILIQNIFCWQVLERESFWLECTEAPSWGRYSPSPQGDLGRDGCSGYLLLHSKPF